MIVLPGNHDVNIVDRANPAGSTCRSAPASDCGKCGRCRRSQQCKETVCASSTTRGDDRYLNEALAPHRQRIAAFAERGGLRRAARLIVCLTISFRWSCRPIRKTAWA